MPSSSEEVATRQGISPALQQLLDLEPLLARQRAVVSARDFLLSQLVEAQGEPLGQAAVIDEDDRRAMLLDELDDPRVDRRPDRLRRGFPAGAEEVRDLRVHARLAHVLERNDHLHVELLRAAGVDELDRTAAGDKPADLLERALRRREADALERLAGESLEPLDGQCQVRAALRPRHSVHLVQDQRPNARQGLTRARGQQQEERLRRRDQQVGRVPQHRGALLLRRVAGPDRHLHVRLEPGQRAAQVALDVVVERLQGRDVDEACPLPRLLEQPIEPEEESGERLPRAGRRLDQRVLAGRDLRPAELLRRRRPVERLLEPLTRFRAEEVERGHEV